MMDLYVQNHEMSVAWQFVASTNMSVFLTGKAGTGKTTFLRNLREAAPKRMVVLAPTGVAAINAQGQTIHSFFQLPFGVNVPGMAQRERQSHYKMSKEKKNLIRTLDLLVIDEISMVRSDLLDAVDAELRKYRDRTRPFGGVQLLLIGDLQQLAPVAKEDEWQMLKGYYSTPYFFGSKALEQVQYVTIELKHIYRQQDQAFIEVLANVRNNRLTDETVAALNGRYVKDFQPPKGEDWIRLTTHNRTANDYNEQQLALLPGQQRVFHAEIRKNFPETSYPAEQTLVLKTGAQVMFIKNDPSGQKEYYNGKIGVVTGFDDDGISVYCKEDDQHIAVTPVTWENTKYVIDEETKAIKEQVEGTFTQYPLRLAWAITVHKSQGLTFDHAVVDINDSFAHGQTYVALSRCRTLEGMVLSRPLNVRSVINDASVDAYIGQKLEAARSAEQHLPDMKLQYFLSLLDELFSFRTLAQEYKYLVRVVCENLYMSYPEYAEELRSRLALIDSDLDAVALKFQYQYKQIVASMGEGEDPSANTLLQQRIVAASGYFGGKMHEIFDPVLASASLKINNQHVSTQYNNALDGFVLEYKIKVGVFSRLVSDGGFTVTSYLGAKAAASLDDLSLDKTAVKKEKKKKAEPDKPKREKGASQRTSFNMYREGRSIEEIAKERGMATTTIESHIAQFVKSGDLGIDSLVSTQHQKFIRGVVRSFDRSYTLSDVKALLPPDYTYFEIKLVLADMERD